MYLPYIGSVKLEVRKALTAVIGAKSIPAWKKAKLETYLVAGK
jgi:hypothetical protein